MSLGVPRVLERLRELGFEARLGDLAPFGEELPLVSGVAWDIRTAQVALVAEMSTDDDIGAWRQLLFAASGLRHQLAGDGPAAFGTPVVLALVDEDAERRLRDLSEDLLERYAVFSRVDLNFVRRADLDDDESLDLALAPFLPRCRAALRDEISISTDDVRRFWNMLGKEVRETASRLNDVFGHHRKAAGDECATALIGDSQESTQRDAPTPIGLMELENFRSFAYALIELAPVSVIHGSNGSGKSSLIEGLELLWAHRSQRQPNDVDAVEYARYLSREGSGEFFVGNRDDHVSSVAPSALVELARSVLGQDAVTDLVASSPAARYSGLLTTTGLEIPDLKERTARLVDAAKRDVDAALVAAGLRPLPRRDSDGLKHLLNGLAGRFSARLPSMEDLTGIEVTLERLSGGAFVRRNWDDSDAASALAKVDELLAGVLGAPDATDEVTKALHNAQDKVQHLMAARALAARSARTLLSTLSARKQKEVLSAAPPPLVSGGPAALPTPLAVRWLSHIEALQQAALTFRSEAERLLDFDWRERLVAYAHVVEEAAKTAPRSELERMARPVATGRASPTRRPNATIEQYMEAGFAKAPVDTDAIEVPLRQLADELDRQVAGLQTLVGDLADHPVGGFGEHAERVLATLCRFELTRSIRREGPVMRASEELVKELLQGRLAPVLRELVAAIVRFEWYFKPLQVVQDEQSLVFGGLSTSQPNLDARLVLNFAERHVVGVAWFLALHLLQPPERRRVLVIDDPTSGFDAPNRAGFVATLRAFVRLTRPDQLVAVTQDEVLAAALAEELAPVDDWPVATSRVRCRRDADDMSVASVERTETAVRATGEEAIALGLGSAGLPV